MVRSGQRTCVPCPSKACSHSCERRHGCEGSWALWALTCTGEKERCRSWALRSPWPSALPASSLLAGLRSHCCKTQGFGAWGVWRSRGSKCKRPLLGEAWSGVDALL